MKIKVDPRDKVFSQLIRLRDKYTCQVCGKYYPEGKGLQCSHFWSRRHKATRWDGENACAKCFYCHQYMTANPVEFNRWIYDRLGKDRFAALEQRARQPIRLKKCDKERILAELKQQLQELEECEKSAV